MTGVDPRVFTAHLAVVLLFGAARDDATPQQVGRLRHDVLPLLRDSAVPLTDVVDAVRDVMGPGWEPTGKWADHILALDPGEPA